MNVDETLIYLDNEIKNKKDNSKNSLFILSLSIIDTDVANIEDTIIKYYNNQLISCKIKRCNLTGEYEISIWW